MNNSAWDIAVGDFGECSFEIDEHGLEISTHSGTSSPWDEDTIYRVFSREEALGIAEFIRKNADKMRSEK